MRRWAAGAGLGVLGLLLNFFEVPLTPGIELLFGGVAYLLAAAALGPGPGFLAAAIASVRTVWLWNHPWAWLNFGLEGLVVGWLVTRGKRRPLTADALFWLFIGVPILIGTYRGILGVSGTTATIIFLKQPFNGLVNALIAEALLLVPAVRRALQIEGAPRLRSALALIVSLSAVIPALIFGIWAGQREWARSVELAEDRVEFAARSYGSKLEQYLRLHAQVVRSAAEMVEQRSETDPARLQQLLAAEYQDFPGFLNLYIVDVQGRTLASFPQAELPGSRFPSLDSGENAYLRQLRGTRATTIAEVFPGRGRSEAPLVLIAHPVERGNTVDGYVAGTLNLRVLPRPVVATMYADRLRVVEDGGVLIYDSDRPYRAGDRLRRISDPAALARAVGSGESGTTIYREASSVAAASRTAAQVLVGFAPLALLDWWVWVEYPFEKIEQAVAAPYARLLGLLVALIFLAGLFSTWLAAWLSVPLLRVRGTAAALAGGDLRARVRELPGVVPQEVADLGRGFDEMADALAGRAEESEELSEIARSLASTLDMNELLQRVTDTAMRLLEPDGCGIALLQPDGKALRAAEYTLGLLQSTAGHEFPVDGSLAGWALRVRRPVRVDNVARDDRRTLRGSVGVRDVGSAIVAPLIGRSGPLGTLTAVRAQSSPVPFTNDELRLLERLAQNAAIAVENARLLEQAQAASRAKSDFIAAMSHELRTPLNAVLGHLELLELRIHGELTRAQRESLERIGAATRHLRGLIEEVLSFARLEAGRTDIRLTEVELDEVIREAAAVIEPLARQKQLDFTVESNLDEGVRTDADKVRQILINLAGNAVKFTDAGQVRILVESRETRPDEIVVSVSDTGSGIAPENQVRLFRPFQQLESGYSRRHGGTGLGLYLSRQYAALLGGRIEVQSELGKGSTFSLVLPRQGPNEAAGEASDSEESVSSAR